MKFAIQSQRRTVSAPGVRLGLLLHQGGLGEGARGLSRLLLPRRCQQLDALTTPPQDDRNVVERWAELAEQYDLDMVVCVAAAQRRGLVDEGEAKRNGKDATNIRRASASPVSVSWSRRPFRRTAGRLRRLIGEETMSETIKKFLYLNRKAPYGTIYAWESLEVVLIGAAFDQDVSLAFVDDGVYQLTKGRTPPASA
jgi:tRNA 2-thiouridine synthesizing protein D